jgi:hypothetical protein
MSGSEIKKEPKVPNPDRFDGDKRKYRTFVRQVKLVFELNPSRFSTDHERILYISSYLVGNADRWFDALDRRVIQPAKAVNTVYSLEQFWKDFDRDFSDRQIVANSRRRICDIRQEGSCARYAAQFLTLACDTGFDDASLITHFYRGLRDDVKNVLITRETLPEDLRV